MTGCPGKRGRAISVSTHTTAQVDGKQGERENIVAETTFSTMSNVDSAVIESHIIDLYAMGVKTNRKRKSSTKPFIHQIQLRGPKGEAVRVWATFDEGALMEAMSMETFKRVKHRMGALLPSHLRL